MSFFKTKKCDMAYAINDIYTGMMTTLISNNNKKRKTTLRTTKNR